MKFFLEFVSCCGSLTQNRQELTTLPAEDEKRWLVRVPPIITSRPRRKRGKPGHEWRPSLRSISEDIIVSARGRTDPRNDATMVSTARDVKRRSGGSVGAAKARQHSYRDVDYGEPYLMLPMLLTCAASPCTSNLNIRRPTCFDLSLRRDNWRRPQGVSISFPL